MSTTVTYKGETLTTVNNATKTLETKGTWLEDDLTLVDVSGGGSTLITKNISANGTYNASSDSADGYSQVTVSVPASAVDTGTKQITQNGTGQDVVGYAEVDVAVPNSYSAGDEGKVVSSGALVSQGSDTVTTNDTYDTTLISSLTVNVSGGGDTVIETVVISSATSSICFNDVLQALEDTNYTLTYKDCLLVFRASGTAVPTTLPLNYTYNNQQILVKDWVVWNVNYNRCGYQSGAKTPDSSNPFSVNNALQNSGNIVDANHKIDNTYASAFQAIGGVGTKVVMFEIPMDWSVFFSA